MKISLCLRIVFVIGKYRDCFRGGGGGQFSAGGFSIGIFFLGEGNFRETSQEKF